MNSFFSYGTPSGWRKSKELQDISFYAQKLTKIHLKIILDDPTRVKLHIYERGSVMFLNTSFHTPLHRRASS